MSITTEKYIRKPFSIDAIRVDENNIEAVAKWCSGMVQTERRGTKDVRFIKAPVSRPLTERQTKAFYGDWVLYSNGSWKVYTNKAFESCFERYEQNIIDENQIPLPLSS